MVKLLFKIELAHAIAVCWHISRTSIFVPCNGPNPEPEDELDIRGTDHLGDNNNIQDDEDDAIIGDVTNVVGENSMTGD